MAASKQNPVVFGLCVCLVQITAAAGFLCMRKLTQLLLLDSAGFFLGEQFSERTLVSGLIALLGVYLVNSAFQKK